MDSCCDRTTILRLQLCWIIRHMSAINGWSLKKWYGESMFDIIAVHALFQVASVPKFYCLTFIKYVIVCDTTSTTSQLPSPYSIEVSTVSSPRDISCSEKEAGGKGKGRMPCKNLCNHNSFFWTLCMYPWDTSPETEAHGGDHHPDPCAQECHVPGVRLAYLPFSWLILLKITILTRWCNTH